MKQKKPESRNDVLLDGWSLVHFATGILFGWLMNPIVAVVVMVLWEPLEILILSPILRKFGIIFGYETLKNSLSDIVVDLLGIAVGLYLLRMLITPPFVLF